LRSPEQAAAICIAATQHQRIYFYDDGCKPWRATNTAGVFRSPSNLLLLEARLNAQAPQGERAIGRLLRHDGARSQQISSPNNVIEIEEASRSRTPPLQAYELISLQKVAQRRSTKDSILYEIKIGLFNRSLEKEPRCLAVVIRLVVFSCHIWLCGRSRYMNNRVAIAKIQSGRSTVP